MNSWRIRICTYSGQHLGHTVHQLQLAPAVKDRFVKRVFAWNRYFEAGHVRSLPAPLSWPACFYKCWPVGAYQNGVSPLHDLLLFVMYRGLFWEIACGCRGSGPLR